MKKGLVLNFEKKIFPFIASLLKAEGIQTTDYEKPENLETIMSVSYTHLTLPTKRIV